MNEVSGYGQANLQLDDETASGGSNVAASSDPFGLETYTGQTTRTSEPVEPTQPDQTKLTRPTGQVETQWRTHLGEPVVGSPVAHDGQLIVTGRSGSVYALNTNDGTECWRSASRIATTSPTAKSGLAFIGNEDGSLRAVDTADGSVRWAYEVDGGIEAAPIVQDDLVYVTSAQETVYLIDANSGSRRAAFGHGCRAVCSLAVDRETIFLGSAGGGLQARCISDGRERWRCVPEQAVATAPAVTEERVYVATIDGGNVLETDRVTGAIQNQFDVGTGVWGQPVVTDDALYVASQDGVVSAFDREAGTRRWQVQLSGSVWCGPAVDNGRVYVADGMGRTYALDIAEGEQRWQFDADTAITTTPTVADGVVFVATEAGTVYALAETGI